MVAPTPYQADSQLSRVTKASVGVQIRQGVTLFRTIDAAFNMIHGTGPKLAAMKNPIKTLIGRTSLQFSHVTRPQSSGIFCMN